MIVRLFILGKEECMQKKLMGSLLATASLISASLYAMEPGGYIGLMGGAATNAAKNQLVQVGIIDDTLILTPAKPHRTQFLGRLYLGYQIYPYLGVEGGFYGMSPVSYNPVIPTCDNRLQVNMYGIDFVGKAGFPLGPFDIFAKAGAAGNYIQTTRGLNPTPRKECGKKAHQTKASPTFTIGASYSFNPNWVAELTATRMTNVAILQNVNIYGLGFSYHFVDRYCGQFLCD